MTEHAHPGSPAPTALPPATAGRSMKLPLIVCAVIGIGAIFAARQYKRPDPQAEPAAPGQQVGSDFVKLSATAPAWNVIKVGHPSAAAPHWSDPIPARVMFNEAKTSRLGSPLAGRIVSVMTERGQQVTAGAPLFTVASPNLAELRSDLAKTTLQQATAHTNLERTQALVEAGSMPAKELVTAKQEVAEADLSVKLAEQKLSSLRVAGGADASFTVTAPRSGVVVEKTVSVGQLVDPSNGSLLAIADLSDVWVVADLFENDVGTTVPGTKAKVFVAGADRDATVEQVSSVVDPDRHTVPARVRLLNPDGTLRPNAYATIRFFDPTPVAVSLPAAAVMSDGAQSYVYRKEASGELKRHNVTVGSVSNGIVPVLAGLSATDEVVLSGAILLDNQIQLDN